MNILLGVTGSIAAYKAASVTSALYKQGHNVIVCMTKAATQFVGPVTFSALSHNRVILDEDEFKADGHILHIELAQEWANVVVVAPASFDFMSKIAACRADDALSSICAAWPGNILLCPAMNTVMWENLSASQVLGMYNHMNPWRAMISDPYHPTEDKDFDTLDYTRFVMLEPAKGDLACGSRGLGAMRATQDVVKFIEVYGSGLMKRGKSWQQ